MDSSQSLESDQYNKIKNYTFNLMRRLDYKGGIATMAFAKRVDLVTDFTQFGGRDMARVLMYPHMNEAGTRLDFLICTSLTFWFLSFWRKKLL